MSLKDDLGFELAKQENVFLKNVYNGKRGALRGVLDGDPRLTQAIYVDGNAFNAITIASISGHWHNFSSLLTYPSVVKGLADQDNFTLAIIVKFGNVDFFQELLLLNEDDSYQFPDVVNNLHVHNNRILANALVAGNQRGEIIQTLFRKNYEGNYEFPLVVDDIYAVLHWGAVVGDIELVEWVLYDKQIKWPDGAITNAYKHEYILPVIADKANQLILSAIERGNYNVIDRLLAKVNGQYEFPEIIDAICKPDSKILSNAAINNHPAVVG